MAFWLRFAGILYFWEYPGLLLPMFQFASVVVPFSHRSCHFEWLLFDRYVVLRTDCCTSLWIDVARPDTLFSRSPYVPSLQGIATQLLLRIFPFLLSDIHSASSFRNYSPVLLLCVCVYCH